MSRPDLTSPETRRTTRNVLIVATGAAFAGIADLPLEKVPPLSQVEANAVQAGAAFTVLITFLMASHMLNFAEDALEQPRFGGQALYLWSFMIWHCALPLVVGTVALFLVAPLLIALIMAGLSATTIWYGWSNLK